MTKKYQIWENTERQYDNDRGGMLIPQAEIYPAVYLGDASYYSISGLSEDLIEKLDSAVSDWEIDSEDDLKDFLQAQEVTFESIDRLSDLEKVADGVYYDQFNRNFFRLHDLDAVSAYQWHDGSNWRTETAGEDITVTEVTVEDGVYQDLDEWDGSNWQTGRQRFYHEKVYKIIELDSEPVKDMFLLYEYSQWQGDHATGRVMTAAELEAHIEELSEEEEN